MARLRNIALSDEEDEDDQSSSAVVQPGTARGANLGSMSPSPAASFSSDKENRGSASESAAHQANGKSKAMGPPKLPTPASAEALSPRANKRRRLGERAAPNASQMAHERELRELGNTQFYDPDQDMDERRAVRKGLRDLSKELTGRSQ